VAAGETTSVLLELGWPAKALSPNSREHFMTKWRYAKASKDTAFWATRASLGHAELKHDGSRTYGFLTDENGSSCAVFLKPHEAKFMASFCGVREAQR
jgi:hypothetical protein